MHDDLALALSHYALIFPDLSSLGTGAPPSAWYAEYNRVADAGLGATLVTQTGMEGGTSVSAARNFDQKTLLWALHVWRSTLDPTYQPPAFQPANILTATRISTTVRFGC